MGWMVATVVTGDAGPVPAPWRAPLPPRVILGEEEQAVGRQARAQPVSPRTGEEFDALVGDQFHCEAGGAVCPVGARWVPVGRPDELRPSRRERVERGDRLRPGQ